MRSGEKLSSSLIKNFFLSGPPSIGKTTVIKKMLTTLTRKATGFHTSEIKQHDKRIGFLMKTLEGKEGLLAHEMIKSTFHIRRYGVSIENIDLIAVPSITPKSPDEVVVIDEIGKMECFSEKFCESALNALNGPNMVIGTIAVGGTDLIRAIKERKDIKIFEVTLDNRDILPAKLSAEIERFFTP
jgi:nucleoside-triphosphatase THEP1